jgi:hypothetical protein
MFRGKAVEVAGLLSICSGSVLPSSVYTVILCGVLLLTYHFRVVLLILTEVQLYDIRLSWKRETTTLPADVFARSVGSMYCRWNLIITCHSFEKRFVNVDKLTPG